MNEDYAVSHMPPMQSAPPVAKRSSWPTVLGVIALVMGGMSVLGGCVGLGSMFAVDWLIEMAGEEEAGQLLVLRDWKLYTIISQIGTMLLAVVLITAGVGLLKRSAWAATLCMVWAITKLIFELACFVPAMQLQSEQMAASLEDSSGQVPAGFEGMMQAFAIGSMCLTYVFILALPAFFIIWFLRRPVREEVARWRVAQYAT